MRLFTLLAVLAVPGAAAVAIQDVTVVDVATGTTRPHQTVFLHGDTIFSLGPVLSTPIPQGTRIVDGKNRFLIPGLWDMHVHLWNKENPLPTFVAFGVTGVRDMGSDFKRVSNWRDAVEDGRAVGPRIITSGPAVNGDLSADERFPMLTARSPIEARKAFDKLWELNVDFIRVLPGLSRDSYIALAEQARHWDLALVGEVPPGVSAWDAVEARQRSLEHMSGVPESVSDESGALECFDRCAKYGVRVSPMLVWWRRMANLDEQSRKSDPRLKYVPASIRSGWAASTEVESRDASSEKVDRIYQLVALTRRAKVELLAGTDTGSPYTIPGATLHDELEQLVRAGLTPREALESATLAPIRFLGLRQAMGTIEKGKFADMVLLDGNPLDSIGNVRKVAGVFTRGRYYSRQDLDGILAAVK